MGHAFWGPHALTFRGAPRSAIRGGGESGIGDAGAALVDAKLDQPSAIEATDKEAERPSFFKPRHGLDQRTAPMDGPIAEHLGRRDFSGVFGF